MTNQVFEQVRQSIHEQVDATLEGLRPEIEQLEQARAIFGVGSTNGSTAKPSPSSAAPARRRRNRKGGNRNEEFLNLVGENPGITVTDAAKKLNIKPNYLYRVAGKLVQEKALRKENKGYVAV